MSRPGFDEDFEIGSVKISVGADFRQAAGLGAGTPAPVVDIQT
jgi:hypothetical protein